MSFALVYLLGGAPVFLSLVAAAWNASADPSPALKADLSHVVGSNAVATIAELAEDVWPTIVADAYLYACIIALAGVWDSVNDTKQEATIAFGLLAGNAGLGEFMSLLKEAPRHSLIWHIQSSVVWLFLISVALCYFCYKILTLYGFHVEEWTRARLKQTPEITPA